MNDLDPILLAEDDETDVLLLERALKEAGIPNPLRVVVDGQEAVDYLSALQHAPSPGDRSPALLILDLKMPRMTGLDVLGWVRAQPGLACLPVMMFSSSSHQLDIERAYALGANAFVVKAPSTSERIEFARFIKSWLHFNQRPMACTEGIRAAHAHHAPKT
ncbi:MAG TPA: response regulator [Opitutaceae bacterium]|nr:response regulator [Opitutaceae bacterium]